MYHEREGVYDVLQNGLCLPGRFKGNMLLDTWHAFFDTMDRMKEKRAYHFEGRSWRLPGISEPLNPSIFIPKQKSCKSNSFLLGIEVQEDSFFVPRRRRNNSIMSTARVIILFCHLGR